MLALKELMLSGKLSVCLRCVVNGRSSTLHRGTNKAAITKQFWSVSMKQDKLWVKWLHVYYIKQHNVLTVDIPNRLSWSMKKILSSKKMFIENQAP